jgi:hypothetical protein
MKATLKMPVRATTPTNTVRTDVNTVGLIARPGCVVTGVLHKVCTLLRCLVARYTSCIPFFTVATLRITLLLLVTYGCHVTVSSLYSHHGRLQRAQPAGRRRRDGRLDRAVAVLPRSGPGGRRNRPQPQSQGLHGLCRLVGVRFVCVYCVAVKYYMVRVGMRLFRC